MDIETTVEQIKLTDEIIDLAKRYAGARLKSAKSKKDLDILLASKYLTTFRSEKPNLGLEMALLMLIEREREVATTLYSDYLTATAEYKGLEEMLNAVKTKVSYMQSIMKYEIEGVKGFKDYNN